MNDFIEKNKEGYEHLCTVFNEVSTRIEFIEMICTLNPQDLYLLAKIIDKFEEHEFMSEADVGGLNTRFLEDGIMTGYDIARIVKNEVFCRYIQNGGFILND